MSLLHFYMYTKFASHIVHYSTTYCFRTGCSDLRMLRPLRSRYKKCRHLVSYIWPARPLAANRNDMVSKSSTFPDDGGWNVWLPVLRKVDTWGKSRWCAVACLPGKGFWNLATTSIYTICKASVTYVGPLLSDMLLMSYDRIMLCGVASCRVTSEISMTYRYL